MKELKNNDKLILDKWRELNIYNKTLNSSNENFVFFDGPATANGYPGLHHMVAKFLKDTFCKYQTMNQKNVIRKIGWDTHGLPVELQVEKELGFNSKTDIENYGIEPFNVKCRESVLKNKNLFEDLTTQMGQFADLDNPYITYDNNYIETLWWILKKFHTAGLFYEGHKIVPYCPRCGTALASHEVAQGYKDVSVDTVIAPFKLIDEDAYFLVWTTTPWTLISNVALCVNPHEEYVKVKSQDNTFILAKKLLNAVLGDETTILETFTGKDLEYTKYEQLMPFIKPNKDCFIVTCDEYVTMTDGTGIVHIAPAFGEDDKAVGEKYNLPVINPVSEEGTYLEGPWKDMLVFEADLPIIKYLKENDKLFKKQKVTHNYPHCWRCSTPLIYYSKPSFYLKVTDFKDKIIKNNKTVNWYPSYVGEKRFGNWLENLNDWAISRNRYWGTPLPYYTCECGHDHMIGSKEELIKMSVEDIDDTIDLHRPFIDNVHITCPKCSKPMTRVTDVIDCWFDSGAMPFAQYHYPFENKELFESQFPADFICEGVDQTRGWFYTLLVISTFVMDKAPYKNVLVNDLLLDASGKKMSKSKGNIVEPFSAIKEYGADTVRFYLPYTSPVWTPLKFDFDGLKEVYSKFFNPLKNTYNFFTLYAKADNIDINTCYIKEEDREEIDRWILSKYNSLVKVVREGFDEYDLNKVVKAIASFTTDDLSNWYIRRTRARFWQKELDNSKKSVYITTYEILVGLSKLTAPIAPFITEEIYTNLTDDETVHTASYPVSDASLIDESLEEKMKLLRDLISIGRKVREENKVKVRQPISEVILENRHKKTLGNLTELLKEELNVKNITFKEVLTDYMNYEVLPNYKVVGKTFGPLINDFKAYLASLSNEDILKLNNNEELTFNDSAVTLDMVTIRLSAKEGLSIAAEDKLFIILNLNLTSDLINEGITREFVSKVQQLRKTIDLNITDNIEINYNSTSEVINALTQFESYILSETLGVKLTVKDLAFSDKLNEHEFALEITKI